MPQPSRIMMNKNHPPYDVVRQPSPNNGTRENYLHYDYVIIMPTHANIAQALTMPIMP